MRKAIDIKKIKEWFGQTLFSKAKSGTGFTLLEILVTIFVISVGLIGGMTAILYILGLSSYSASKLTAAYLAQEGIEIVRNIRDTNWLEAHNKGDFTPWDEGFFSPINCASGCEIDYTSLNQEDPVFSAYSGRKLKIDTVNGFYNYYSFGTDTKFTRKITIQPDPTDPNNILIIMVNVSWEDRGKTYNFPTVQEKLYRWY